MDARYYNGGPDDRPCFPPSGEHQEPKDPNRGMAFICAHCQGSVITVYSLAGVGVFCSADCRSKGIPVRKQGAA
jgi:hypothetical protein